MISYNDYDSPLRLRAPPFMNESGPRTAFASPLTHKNGPGGPSYGGTVNCVTGLGILYAIQPSRLCLNYYVYINNIWYCNSICVIVLVQQNQSMCHPYIFIDNVCSYFLKVYILNTADFESKQTEAN